MKTSIANLLGRRQSIAMPDTNPHENNPAFLGVKKVAADFRTLKATLPADEFAAVQWAARNTSWLMPDGQRGKSMPLADWLRAAVLAKVRETVKDHGARGKAIPPDIAAVIDEKRAR